MPQPAHLIIREDLAFFTELPRSAGAPALTLGDVGEDRARTSRLSIRSANRIISV
ncbi:MAG TPA: hypothetical protein VFQ92_17475 [Blastocatellia bacterium]|nr:hypothetical protein [Blastocatellia bacterium]